MSVAQAKCIARWWRFLRWPTPSVAQVTTTTAIYSSVLTTQQRHFTIPVTESLTRPVGTSPSDSYVITKDGVDSDGLDEHDPDHSNDSSDSKGFRFAIKDSERGVLDHGVSPEAKHFIAEAEEQYRASSAYLHAPAGGAGLPDVETYVDPVTGMETTVTRIAAPFGDQYIPSSQERFAHRGAGGELAAQQAMTPKYLLDERSQLNLKKERQLTELLSSPMPALEKAQEVSIFLEECAAHQLALQPRTAEAVMMLYSRLSLELRLKGRRFSKQHQLVASTAPSSSSRATVDGPQDVPLLDEMRRLYAHQKASFVAPTSLTVEYLMVTLSAAQETHKGLFHLANRLLLDCDKYVVLPTRSTYSAFFSICHTNGAMPFAIARFKDAVSNLCVPTDAGMATALLKGLNEGGLVQEAVLLLARLKHVPMTTPLLNASLETLLLSQDPLACFAVYESLRSASVRPNAETYTLLLLACEQSGQWGRVTALLADMQRRKVKGNSQTLNLMLKGLLKERLNSYALQLFDTMEARNVEVWPALEEGVRAARKHRRLRD